MNFDFKNKLKDFLIVVEGKIWLVVIVPAYEKAKNCNYKYLTG